MSQAKAIEDMDFKELRQEVRKLSDKLARMERGYADTLENLDDDNFSAQTLKEKEKMKTDIRNTEEGLEIVTEEVYPDGTNSESAIAINANEIKTVVKKCDELNEDVSEISQTAEEISMEVTDLKKFKKSVFTQTAYGFTLDGEQTTFTGVIYLTDNDGNKEFSISHDESQGFAQVCLFGSSNKRLPVVIGTNGSVYIGSVGTGNEVATRSWVQSLLAGS